MTPFNEFYKDQNEYPGSHQLICHNSFSVPFNGKPRKVEFLFHTNPNNITTVASIIVKFNRKYSYIRCETYDDPIELIKNHIKSME
jgi:hypothetical protein